MRYMYKLARRLALNGVWAVAALAAFACADAPVSAPESAIPISSTPLAAIVLADRVVALQPAYIRSAPRYNASLVGVQPAGALGTVVAGPVVDASGDGLTRWQIDFDNGPDGWAAEPYVDSPGTLVFGSRVRTTENANIRNGPSGSATQVGVQPANASGSIVAGPVVDAAGDRLTRWQINFDQGPDGWAADDYFVAAPGVPVPPAIASVVVTPAAGVIDPGATIQLAAEVRDVLGALQAGVTPVWSSLDTLVGRVTTTGLVTGLAAGTVSVVAAASGRSDTAAITVRPVIASVVVTPATGTIDAGATIQLAAQARDVLGAVLAGVTPVWSSLDTLVARVSTSGLVTGRAAGTVSVVAAASGRSDTAAITVRPAIASVVVTPATGSIDAGATIQLAAQAHDVLGAVLAGVTPVWSSLDTVVARVSTSGVVTGRAVGTVSVVATASGRSDTAAITVRPTIRAGYYVSATAMGGGNGSINSPWTLANAVSGAGGRVQPGDTIWVRGGTYSGAFSTTVRGASGRPVVIRAYPGERAIIDAAGTAPTTSTFAVRGDYTVVWGLEVTNTTPSRWSASTGNGGRSPSVVNYASNTKYINLVVHDGGVAFYTEAGYSNVEVTGGVFYNNGWDAPDRGHGHALYLKSNAGPVTVRDNVMFNQFGYGIHVYTNAGSGQLNNIRFEGNVAFNNGTVSSRSSSANILLGGDDYATGDVLRDNLTYFSPGISGANVKVGYGSLRNGDVEVQGNYFVGGAPVLDVGYWATARVSSNTVIGAGNVVTLNDQSRTGKVWSANVHQRDPLAAAWRFGGQSYSFSQWRLATGYAPTDLAVTGSPAFGKVVVRGNPYESGRAMVVVYNWGRLGHVTADLSGILVVGERYEVRNVQNMFGAPVASGTYGGPIVLPMSGVAPPAVIGLATTPAPRTGPDFDVFIVTKR